MERNQNVDLNLFDLQGRLLSNVYLEELAPSFEFQLAKLMEALPKNKYILEMRTEDGFIWRKKLLVD